MFDGCKVWKRWGGAQGSDEDWRGGSFGHSALEVEVDGDGKTSTSVLANIVSLLRKLLRNSFLALPPAQC